MSQFETNTLVLKAQKWNFCSWSAVKWRLFCLQVVRNLQNKKSLYELFKFVGDPMLRALMFFSMVFISLTCWASEPMAYSHYYTQEIHGSVQTVKTENLTSQYSCTVNCYKVSIEIQYVSFNACQKAIGLMTPERIVNGRPSNDFELLMGSQDVMCAPMARLNKKTIELPNILQEGEVIKIGERRFELRSQDGQSPVMIEVSSLDLPQDPMDSAQ